MNMTTRFDARDMYKDMYHPVTQKWCETQDAAIDWFNKMFGDVKVEHYIDPLKAIISVYDEAVYCVEVVGPVFDERRQVYCWNVVGRDLVGEIYD